MEFSHACIWSSRIKSDHCGDTTFKTLRVLSLLSTVTIVNESMKHAKNYSECCQKMNFGKQLCSSSPTNKWEAGHWRSFCSKSTLFLRWIGSSQCDECCGNHRQTWPSCLTKSQLVHSIHMCNEWRWFVRRSRMALWPIEEHQVNELDLSDRLDSKNLCACCFTPLNKTELIRTTMSVSVANVSHWTPSRLH